MIYELISVEDRFIKRGLNQKYMIYMIYNKKNDLQRFERFLSINSENDFLEITFATSSGSNVLILENSEKLINRARTYS